MGIESRFGAYQEEMGMGSGREKCYTRPSTPLSIPIQYIFINIYDALRCVQSSVVFLRFLYILWLHAVGASNM